ncbi:MAG: hypothetical protein WAT37_06720 [Saprospiraceae bacterium]
MLNETISYFWGRPERKCVDEFGNCKFSPTNTQTEGCALGRYLSKTICLELDKINTNVQSWPKWLDSNKYFAGALRDLHDDNTFVNKDKDKVLSVMCEYVDGIDIVFPD